MKNIIGPPVEGEDFFGREKELNYVWQQIKDGNNFIFPSPRRVGKTSFALKLLEMAKKEGWDVISMNLEKINTELSFTESFVEVLKKQSTWEQIKEKGNGFWIFSNNSNPALRKTATKFLWSGKYKKLIFISN